MPRSMRQADLAATDMIGTILMVAVVVAIGAALALLATAALTSPDPVSAGFVLKPPAQGDTTLRLVLAQGESVPTADLRLLLSRNGSAAAEAPRATWGIGTATVLAPGSELSLPLAPPAAPGERLQVTVVATAANEVLATLTTRAGSAPPGFARATLSATLAPSDVTADGVTTSRLTVRVSHPMGALVVSSVVADLSRATTASGSGPMLVTLADAGGAGDTVGGDGVWSALLTFPRTTPLGSYVLDIYATDASGSLNSNTTLPFRVTSNGVEGDCMGCTLNTGDRSSQGTRLRVPTSANVTLLKLVNWTTDQLYPQRLDEDYVMFRITGGTMAWSVLIELEEFNGQPYAIAMRMWTNSAESTYLPRNLTGGVARLPLTNLSMDLLQPVASLQWVVAPGSPAPDPLATYPRAGVAGSPAFLITYMGQDQTTGNAQRSLNTGIFSFDVSVAQ